MNLATETNQASSVVWNGAIGGGRGSGSQMVVVGAGPYGLAAAAHLKAADIETRTFGETMGFWRRNMPKGMHLRSPWKGSTIADPLGRYTLDTFVERGAIVHREPLPLQDFLKYGEWFQREAVPDVDPRKVVRVELAAGGFSAILEDGERVRTERVLIATGLAKQEYFPAAFTGFSRDLVSHSVDHANFDRFRGKRVAVIGRGQSAAESAVLLSEAGAEVEMIGRGPIHWIGSEDPNARDLKWKMLRAITPPSPVGPFPMSWVIDTPGLFRMLPKKWQTHASTAGLRAAAAAWLAPQSRAIRMTAGVEVVSTRIVNDSLAMKLDNGSETIADHVVAATGYKIDISKQGILGPDLLHSIRTQNGAPVLGRGYESTVPGLHFMGSASISSFGPLMQFIWGAGYAARSLTRSVLARL